MEEVRSRRRHPRVTISADAQIDGPDTRVQLVDLSPGGAAIRSASSRATRSELRLTFDLEKQRMTPRARVAYCLRDEQHYRIGLEFEPLSIRDGALIDRLVWGQRGTTP